MNYDILLLLTFTPVFFVAYKCMTSKSVDLFEDVSKKEEK
jgi:hypothetical protein